MYGPVQTDSRLLDVKVMLHGTIFFADIRKNVLPKFIKLCMETQKKRQSFSLNFGDVKWKPRIAIFMIRDGQNRTEKITI